MSLHPVMEQALRGVAPIAEEKGGDVHYRIEGTLEDVQRAIANLFREFNYVGYGTRVRDLQDMYPSDHYLAIVTRRRSCE